MRALAARMGLADAVVFTGERSDMPDMLAASDVAIHCSRSENVGGSIEALMMGRPFVATRVGGLVDTTIHERTGLLVPPDDPEALAAAIVRLLQDPSLSRRLGDAGRRLMLDRFTVRRTVDDLSGFFNRDAGEAGYRPDVPARRARQLRTRVWPLVLRLRLTQLSTPRFLWEKLRRLWQRADDTSGHTHREDAFR
jgi:hypothetical protein